MYGNLTQRSILMSRQVQIGLCTLARLAYYRSQALADKAGKGFGALETQIVDRTALGDPSMLIAKGVDQSIIAIEGTTGFEQWLTHLRSNLKSESGDYPGKTQDGFRQFAFRGLPIVLDELNAQPRKTLVLVGHSLGGAMAQLIGYRIMKEFPGRLSAIFTIGSPKVGDGVWAQESRLPHVRLCAVDDPVTASPPYGFEFGFGDGLQIRLSDLPWAHCGKPLWLNDEGQLADAHNENDALWTQTLNLGPIPLLQFPAFGPHKMDQYLLRHSKGTRRVGNEASKAWRSVNNSINESEGLQWRMGSGPKRRPDP